MRGRAHKVPENANVDLTPMLDVVFILLIFFIVTSTFIQEKAIALEPPPPGCDGCPKPVTPPAIVIYLDSHNAIRIGAELLDIASVRSGIEKRRAETPDAAVIIQAHPDARSGAVIRLRDIVYDAKIERVNIVRSS